MTSLLVPSRFRGPASSGNGGWTAGALAALVAPAGSGPRPTVQVTLRQPPPLDTPLPVADGVAAGSDGVVAEAVLVGHDLAPVDPVPAGEAEAATAAYAGWTSHPFPGCFACGTERAEGDGLRIFPGRVADDAAGRSRVAATWTPDPSTAEDFHRYTDARPLAPVAVGWAALDCVGAWAGDIAERMMVLGRMTARLVALPRIGERHVVMGGARGRDGRKNFTASSLYDADGRLVGTAEHIWFEVDPADFG